MPTPPEIPLPITLLLLALVPVIVYAVIGVWRHGLGHKQPDTLDSVYRGPEARGYLSTLAFGAWLEADPPTWEWPDRPDDWRQDA